MKNNFWYVAKISKFLGKYFCLKKNLRTKNFLRTTFADEFKESKLNIIPYMGVHFLFFCMLSAKFYTENFPYFNSKEPYF